MNFNQIIFFLFEKNKNESNKIRFLEKIEIVKLDVQNSFDLNISFFLKIKQIMYLRFIYFLLFKVFRIAVHQTVRSK